MEGVVYGCGCCAASLAIVSGEAGGLFNGTAGDFAPGRFDDDVRTWYTSGMEPDIVGCCLMKGDFFVLAAVFANQHGETITALQVQRSATARRDGFSFERFPAFAFPGCFLSFLLW